MRFVVNSRGEYYHIIEEIQCPFKEKDIYIILKDGEIIFWQKDNNYYQEMTANIETFRMSIEELELTNYRSQVRKDKALVFFRETLNKMIAHKRQIKINEVLDKTPKESVWLVC